MATEQLNGLRERIAEVRAALASHAVPAGRNRTDAAREIDAAIAEATVTGRRHMGHIVAAGPAGQALQVTVSRAGVVDLLPLMLALIGAKAVKTALGQFVEALPVQPDHAEHSARLAELEAELHGLELEEERAIRALEAQGLSVIRRGDADPAVVLADDLSA